MSTTHLCVRDAVRDDLVRLGELAGELVRLHHTADPRRFLLVEDVERGYASWFERELANPLAVLRVATLAGAVVGYGYATLEGRAWNALLDEHGAIHDVMVAREARGAGAGRAIVADLCAELEARGASRVVLSTMVKNQAAQRAFRACGFRPTMLEMTRG